MIKNRQPRTAAAEATFASIETEYLPRLIVDLAKKAIGVDQAKARQLYAEAMAAVDELEDRIGADLQVTRNNLNTAASMHFIPDAAATHAKRIVIEMEKL